MVQGSIASLNSPPRIHCVSPPISQPRAQRTRSHSHSHVSHTNEFLHMHTNNSGLVVGMTRLGKSFKPSYEFSRRVVALTHGMNADDEHNEAQMFGSYLLGGEDVQVMDEWTESLHASPSGIILFLVFNFISICLVSLNCMVAAFIGFTFLISLLGLCTNLEGTSEHVTMVCDSNVGKNSPKKRPWIDSHGKIQYVYVYHFEFKVSWLG